jgi:hypothetical protein
MIEMQNNKASWIKYAKDKIWGIILKFLKPFEQCKWKMPIFVIIILIYVLKIT